MALDREPRGGCSGDCCVAFPISVTRANLWVNQGVKDGLDLLLMLVPITVEEARDRRAQFGVTQPVDEDATYYKCVHWDETSRLCRNYDNRPAMCRHYPYARACEHGCSCQQGRPPLLWEGDQA